MKKKLLAFVLSAAMLTESVLPVVAADDVEVSANEVTEETAEEAAAEEETAAEVVAAEDTTVEDTVVAMDVEVGKEIETGESIDAYVVDGKIDKDTILASLNPENGKVLDVSEKNGEVVVEMLYQISLDGQEAADYEIVETDLVNATTDNPYYMYPANPKVKTYDLGAFDVKGQNVNLSVDVGYYETIYYRTRAVKPATDLYVSINPNSGIYNVAKKLMPEGYTFNSEVIKWKFSPRKNKNSNSGSQFTVKGTVNSKIAKQMGIKGKDLSILKKAMKKLNKEMKYVKKKDGIDNRISFTIKPLVFQDITGGMWITVTRYYGWGGTRIVLSPIYCRLEESQPTTWDKKKWSKIPKKEYKTKILNNGNKIVITPNQKNLVGDPLTFE